MEQYDFERWLEEDINDDAGPRLFAFIVGSCSGVATTLVAEYMLWPLLRLVWGALWL